MANSKQIVYLSQAQYAELIANGSITVDGVTVTYDENDIYVTPQAEPVTDVRVAGTSAVVNGVANVPMATNSTLGVVRGNQAAGTNIYNGQVCIWGINDLQAKQGSNTGIPVTAGKQHLSVFYGLAKAAGHDEKSSPESLGTYTPEAKGAIQKMLGVSDLIATEENNLIASKAYAVGDVFTANGKLYKATAAIAVDGAIIVDGENTNCEEVTVADGFPHDVQVNEMSVVSNGVANIPIANTNNLGVVKAAGSTFGININSLGQLSCSCVGPSEIKQGTGNAYRPLPSGYAPNVVFYNLAKAAGADEKDSTLPVGTYTDTAKTAIRSMIGATSSNVIAIQDTQPTDTDTKIWLPETAEIPVEVPTVAEMEQALSEKVDDVQVNGTSIVSNGVASIPIASSYNQVGLMQIGTDSGLLPSSLANGSIMINPATDSYIKAGNKQYFAITTTKQHMAAFYGLAKAAGDTTQSVSSNTVGNYTDNAKASIKAMLGIQDGSTGTVDISGTDPVIAAVENTRYVCGEVTSLNFTPPASGISIVRFISGSTVTVLTIPSTVKFPEWFDPTSLETNTIYEICVTDGEFGAVMTWAL